MKFANKQVEQLPLANLTAIEFLTLAIETCGFLGWVLGDVSATGFIAYTTNGLFSWNAEVRLKIKNGLAVVQSECRGDDIMAISENKKLLQNFISRFNYLKKSAVCEPVAAYKNFTGSFSLN